MKSPNCLSVPSTPLSVTSRGETRTDTIRCLPSAVRPFGSAVHMMFLVLMVPPSRDASSREGVAVPVPILGRDQVGKGDPGVAELAAQGRLHRGAEEEDVNLDGDGRLARDAAGRTEVIGESQIELDRGADQAEHVERAAGAQIPRELRRLADEVELKVDAGHDMDVAAGDHDIDRDVGADLDRRLQHLDAVGADGDPKESTAAE